MNHQGKMRNQINVKNKQLHLIIVNKMIKLKRKQSLK
jgi:hypothetical protein